MTPRQFLESATGAARKGGARRADGYHRRSHTRLVTLGADGDACAWSIRSEEGATVRAWGSGAEFSLASAVAGGDPEPLGLAAAAGMPGPAARARGSGRAAAVAADADPPAAGPELLDPEILRLSRNEAEQRLRGLAEVAGAARRAGLPADMRAELRLSVVDSHLLDVAGSWHESRTTLASFRLAFASAFGISRWEIASRRLADLDSGPLLPWLAAYPTPRPGQRRLRAEAADDGEVTLVLSPPVVASLMGLAARRAGMAGRPLLWPAAGRLLDNPLRDWGPGSIPFDGEGGAPRCRLLGGRDAGDDAVALTPRRLSWKDPPWPSPSGLELEGLPGAAPAKGERLELLEVALRHGDRLLARGRRTGASEEQAVLADLPAHLEDLLGDSAAAGRPLAWCVADVFASAPALTLAGWRLV